MKRSSASPWIVRASNERGNKPNIPKLRSKVASNPTWSAPIAAALAEAGIAHEVVFLEAGEVVEKGEAYAQLLDTHGHVVDATLPLGDAHVLTTAQVQAAALAAHRALGVEVYSRVDVLLDEDDVPYVLGVNTIPGTTSTSLLPKAAAAVGIDYPALCARILELSLEVKR